MGSVCLNSTANTLCFGSNCLNTSDVSWLKAVPDQLNASSVCLGSSCLNSSDIAGLKLVNSQINSTSLCLSGQCLLSTEIPRIETVPNQVNSTSICIGNACLNSTDILVAKGATTRINTSSICFGATCLVESEVSRLRATISQFNSTAICLGGDCLVSTDFLNVLNIPRKPHGLFSLTGGGPCSVSCYMNFTSVFSNQITISGSDFILPDAGAYSFQIKLNSQFSTTSTCFVILELWVTNPVTQVSTNMYQSIENNVMTSDEEFYNIAFVNAVNSGTKVAIAARTNCTNGLTFDTSAAWSRVMIEKVSG